MPFKLLLDRINWSKKYYHQNKKKIILKNKNTYFKNKELILKKRSYLINKYPWKYILGSIKQRCNNPNDKAYKDYGGRGIKCLITESELRELWFRDKAYLLKIPSIDRENNDGHYVLDNCRFIEKGLNSSERNTRVLSKPILQYSLEGKFIREWKSISEAQFITRIFSIGKCCNNKQVQSGGFIWKFKEKENETKITKTIRSGNKTINKK